MSIDGLISLRSASGPQGTLGRLENAIKARGLTIFARIDHARGAAEAGLTLRPTLLVIFGNARGGTPLMQAAQTLGIDLPLKALVWEDAARVTWLSYNEPPWLAARHGVGAQVEAPVKALTGALAAIAAEATAAQPASP
jgi:uncharacterized protein (DUF302 family)